MMSEHTGGVAHICQIIANDLGDIITHSMTLSDKKLQSSKIGSCMLIPARTSFRA